MRGRKPRFDPKLTLVSFEQRLAHGNLTIPEVCALASRSKTRFYADVQMGLVAITKIGRKSVVYGPVAQRYARGEAPSK